MLHSVKVDGMDPTGHSILVAVLPPTNGTLIVAPFPEAEPAVTLPAVSVPWRPFPLASWNLLLTESQPSAVATKYGRY